MLALERTGWPKISKGRSISCRMRLATTFRSPASRMFSTRTANSSPPRRAAESCGRSEAAQPFGHRNQHDVAGGMAQRVVDLLEAVQVQKQYAAALVAASRAAR